MQIERCSTCLFALDLKNEASYCFCEICKTQKLCSICLTRKKIPFCPECTKTIENTKEKDTNKGEGGEECIECGNVYGLTRCELCTHFYCVKCIKFDHTCYECHTKGCGMQYKRICSKQQCFTRNKIHQREECEKTCSRICLRCDSTVFLFGPEKNKCAVPVCPLVYVCNRCEILSNYYNYEKPYCINHTSIRLCRCCKLYYPYDLSFGYGSIKILILLGKNAHEFACCGRCLKKIRALVENSLIIIRRNKLVFPKVLMDKIVLFTFDITT